MTDHKQTHPAMTVPEIVTKHYPADQSWHQDECPSFSNASRGELIYWNQEGADAVPQFSIWQIDDDGCLTEDELAQGNSIEDLEAWLRQGSPNC